MTERRNGQEGMGPFTMVARKTLLDRLLEVQRDVGIAVISEAEIGRIQDIWRDDESLLAVKKADRVLAMMKKT